MRPPTEAASVAFTVAERRPRLDLPVLQVHLRGLIPEGLGDLAAQQDPERLDRPWVREVPPAWLGLQSIQLAIVKAAPRLWPLLRA
jgi:hypothetical protein